MTDNEPAGAVSWRMRLAIWAVLLLLFVGIPVGIFLWMTSVPGHSFQGERTPPTPERIAMASRLRADVTAIASEPHNLSHQSALLRSETYIAGQLRRAGYEVRVWDVLLPARNLEIELKPQAANAPTLVIGAHYDSFMSAPGANDNGSGTAALLELARLLRRHDGRMAKRLRLIFFVNEEPPYFKSNAMGSKIAADMLDGSGEHIEGMISLETMGYFDDRPGSQRYPFPLSIRYPDRGNFIAFVGDLGSRSFLREALERFRHHAQIPSVGGTAPSFVQGIDWSDHWAFSQKGVPSFMVTDTAPFRYPHYHKGADRPDKLDYERLTLVVEGLHAMMLELAVSTDAPKQSSVGKSEAIRPRSPNAPTGMSGYPAAQPNGSPLTGDYCVKVADRPGNPFDNTKTCLMIACDAGDKESCDLMQTYNGNLWPDGASPEDRNEIR